MVKGIHIFGASGSGTTSLGKALSKKYGFTHFDSDDYFWLPTNPPFIHKRPIEERQKLLSEDLHNNEKWVLTGSLCGWGNVFIDDFDLVIYLWVPTAIRLKRLSEREIDRFGERISPSRDMYENHREFLKWAFKYDQGGLDMRSKATHENYTLSIKNLSLKSI